MLAISNLRQIDCNIANKQNNVWFECLDRTSHFTLAGHCDISCLAFKTADILYVFLAYVAVQYIYIYI